MTVSAFTRAWPKNITMLDWARIFGIAALVGTMLSLPLTNLFVALALIFWLLSGANPGQTWSTDFKNPAVSGALLLMLWMLLSTIWSNTTIENTLVGVWKYRKLLYVPLMVILFAEASWRSKAIVAWLVASVVLILYSLIRLLPDPIGDGHMGVHPALPLSTHTYISLGFVLIPLLTLGLAWMHKSKTNGEKGLSALLILLIVAFVVLAQQGRTSYVILMVLLIFYVLTQLQSRQKWLAMGILVLSASGIGLFSSKVQDRVTQVITDSRIEQTTETISSSGLRIGFWRTTADIIKRNPVLGTGMGTWADEYRKYVVSTPNTPKISPLGGNPHQEYLLMASQVGLIGLALLLAWIIRCIFASRHLQMNERIAAQSLLLAFIMSSFFNSTLFDSATGHFYCIGLGILFAGYTNTNTNTNTIKNANL
jgi:O-antigen ligase